MAVATKGRSQALAGVTPGKTKTAASKYTGLPRANSVQRVLKVVNGFDENAVNILWALRNGEQSITQFCDGLGMARSPMGTVLAPLIKGGIISQEKRDKEPFYSLTGTGIHLWRFFETAIG